MRTNTFFIGDTHFYHSNILKFEKEARPFNSIEDMNEAIIYNWNDVVGVNDTIYHLGDVVFGNKTKHKIINRLNGNKKLILGNHDKLKNLNEYFTDIYAIKQFDGVLLSHIPIHPQQFTRYKANIHGHMHSKNMEDPRYINVSVEQIGLKPISWEDLKIKIYKEIIDVEL